MKLADQEFKTAEVIAPFEELFIGNDEYPQEKRYEALCSTCVIDYTPLFLEQLTMMKNVVVLQHPLHPHRHPVVRCHQQTVIFNDKIKCLAYNSSFCSLAQNCSVIHACFPFHLHVQKITIKSFRH